MGNYNFKNTQSGAITDDSGAGTDGTILDKSWIDNFKTNDLEAGLYAAASDAQPFLDFDATKLGITFGAGGASAQDTLLKRIAASTLAVRTFADGAYGSFRASDYSIGTTTVIDSSGQYTAADNVKAIFGTGSDAEIYYDGTNLVIDPDAVGSGVLSVGGVLTVGNQVVATNSSGDTFTANRTGNAGSYGYQYNGTLTATVQAKSGGGLNFYYGASPTLSMTMNSSGDWALQATRKLYLDSGSNTFLYEKSADNVAIVAGSTEIVNFSSAVATSISASFQPSADNTYVLGGASNRWIDVYAVSGSVNTSDRSQKQDIRPLDGAVEFVLGLNPVSYRWREGKATATTRWGFIAQDVEALVGDVDVAVLDRPEGGPMGLRYHEIIAPLVATVQELAARVAALEAA